MEHIDHVMKNLMVKLGQPQQLIIIILEVRPDQVMILKDILRQEVVVELIQVLLIYGMGMLGNLCQGVWLMLDLGLKVMVMETGD